MTPLEELAIRTAEGDREAFAELYRALIDPVFRYLYWNTGSREDAEDLAEDVFLKALLSMGTFDPRRGQLKAWIFRIAHNLLVDHQRKRSRRRTTELDEEVEDVAKPAPLQIEDEKRAEALRECLAALPSTQRQVITMKYFAGMGNSEVAKALGRSEGAVNALQHRALRRLGETLRDLGWE
ncbi:MAG: RNA polymerase sigma factor [Actinobacteria bacterium]|nr:RNA polymerase sigma factor [Actinomycetota bacterium]